MRRLALLTIFVSLLAIALAYASAFLPHGTPRAAGFVFAIATAALLVAVLVLGAARKGGAKLGHLRWVFLFCFVVLAGGFSLALLAPAVTPDARLFIGLPQGAAIILYVVGLLPLLVLPITYALTFDKTTLSSDELADLRRKLAALQDEREGASL